MKLFDPLPNVVLLGETNVGKSSLFNKLAGQRISVVGDIQDLTRDVISHPSEYGNFNIVDMPGIASINNIDNFVTKLTSVDGFVVVVDNNGWTEKSRKFLNYAMKHSKNILVLVNKSDLGSNFIPMGHMQYKNISVLRNRGLDSVNKHISDWFENAEDQKKDITWGFIGRSNVGKSTLLNKLIGLERFLSKDEFGTTQEASGVNVQVQNRIFHMIDTPGYRKNTKLSDVEKASQYRLLDAINNKAKHFVVLVDITQGISKIDLLLMDKIWSRGKGLVVAIGMWDKVQNMTVLSNARKELQKRFHSVKCIAVSGQTGYGLNNLLNAMNEIEIKMKKKVKTSLLNKWFESLRNTDIFNVAGIKYMTQIGFNPPSFALFSNKLIDQTRMRFLENRLADFLDLGGIHLNLILKHKNKTQK